jgi:hypothetical protein
VPLPLAVKLKSLPLPESANTADPPSALSETINDPVRVPPATGVNVTLIVQFPAGAKFAGQLLVCEKSPAALTPEIAMVVVPLLVKVTGCGALLDPTTCAANVKEVADKLFAGAPAVPLNEIVCGLLGAESVKTIVPVRLPVAVGVNVTCTVQVPPFAATVLQLLVWAKSPVT